MQENSADRSFIDQVFQKRECACFVPSSKDGAKCGCGRSRPSHTCNSSHVNERWTISKHTIASPTDSYGTIEFQGGPHPHKAHFVRLGFDSEPDQILHLFEAVWKIERPKLVISVHGGMANFNLQHKLARVFRKGLFKAAKTTGAWIITSGLNTGVVRHVASALNDGGRIHNKKKIFTIGIAPWGLLKKRDNLVGRDVIVPYHPQAFSPRGRFAVLSDKHSHFLLVDNGTVGRYGADIILRKRFEEFISQQRLESSGKRIPVVCVVLEGGTCTIRAVLDYVTNFPPVPVVVCDGSGRAADLLAFTHKYAGEDGIDPGLRTQILLTIQNVFDYTTEQAEKVFLELMLCVRKKHLVTIFRLGEDQTQDIDHAILTALLKGQDLSAPDQLSLALTWDRVDIARSDIFVYGQEWPPGALDSAMMDALLLDRVEFVKLLLENGVSMERFLTIQRLEELFNTEKGPSYSSEALRLIVQDVVKGVGPLDRLRLEDIGCVIQKLMGSGYRATYCRKDFKKRYGKLTQRTDLTRPTPNLTPKLFIVPSRKSLGVKIANDEDEKTTGKSDEECHFQYPFNELLLWAVLLRRQKMALCMWQHGEEALSKALVACKLYKSMATEAAEDYLEEEICENLKRYSDEFKKLALELLEICYQANEDLTYQLLTYELLNWGKQTCISLAVSANHKEFLAHPCCQILLSDLWLGGMRIRKNSNLKVLLALLCFPVILKLDFKTKQELLLQPQTKEEHIEDMRDDLGSSISVNTEDRYSDIEARSGEVQSDSDSDKEPLKSPDRRASARLGSQVSVHQNTPDGFARKLHLLSRRHSRSNEQINQVSQRPSGTPVSTSSDRHNSVRLSPGVSRMPPTIDPKRKSFDHFRGTLEMQKNYKNRHLGLMRKIREFYIAPITTFWSYTLSYLIFVILFTYVVLIRTDTIPNWAELYVICWIISYGCEKIRKFVMLEPRDFNQKLKVFCENYWNIWSSIAVIVFVIALVLRFSPQTLMIGRVLYCIEIVFWYLKSLEFLSVNKYVGPYITMVGKMIANMIHITLILAIVMASFGVFRQSIHYPYSDWNWQLVRNIFYKPYFMLYGEVYAFEIDTCGDEGKDCVPGGWLTPAFMCIFLLVCNILLINLLIAVFNFIYLEVNAVSHQVWKFQRYNLVMEYEQRPWLPPPLIVFSHLYLLFKFCFRKAGRHHTFDNALKLFLESDDVEKLHDFEEECMEDLFRQRDILVLTSTEDRIRRTTDKVEFLSMKLDDASHRQTLLSSSIQMMDVRMKRVEDMLETVVSNIQETQTLVYRIFDSVSPISTNNQRFPSTSEPLKAVDIVVTDHSVEQISHFPHPLSGILYEDSVSHLSIPSEETQSTSANVESVRKRSSSELIGTDRQKVALRPVRGRVLRSSTAERSIKSAMVTASDGSDYGSPSHAVLERKRAKFYFSSSPQTERRHPDGTYPYTESPRGSPVSGEDDKKQKETAERRSSLPTSPDFKRSLRGQMLSVPLVSRHQSLTPRSPVYGEKMRPRIQEYTTITDNIDTTGVLSPDSDQQHGNTMLPETAPHHHYDGGVFRGMKNAKWSFVVGQNEVMREYEEYGSRITGGLIRNRIKKDSGSICAATPEELQEMGYDQFEYENYMRPRSETSHSSSQGSVTSAKMEDEEGFQQINDCLNHKAQEKKLSGENNSVTAQTSSSTVMTPQSTEPAFNHGKQEYKGITHPLEVMEESD